MKYTNYIGVFAALLLAVACYLPWAYYPDLDKTFNGFFSEQGRYGRPGRAIIVMDAICVLLFLLPKIWAKRLNIVIVAMVLAFCVRNYLLFTSCYRGICPEKKIGIYFIVISSLIMMVSSMLPHMKLKEGEKGGKEESDKGA